MMFRRTSSMPVFAKLFSEQALADLAPRQIWGGLKRHCRCKGMRAVVDSVRFGGGLISEPANMLVTLKNLPR